MKKNECPFSFRKLYRTSTVHLINKLTCIGLIFFNIEAFAGSFGDYCKAIQTAPDRIDNLKQDIRKYTMYTKSNVLSYDLVDAIHENSFNLFNRPLNVSKVNPKKMKNNGWDWRPSQIPAFSIRSELLQYALIKRIAESRDSSIFFNKKNITWSDLFESSITAVKKVAVQKNASSALSYKKFDNMEYLEAYAKATYACGFVASSGDCTDATLKILEMHNNGTQLEIEVENDLMNNRNLYTQALKNTLLDILGTSQRISKTIEKSKDKISLRKELLSKGSQSNIYRLSLWNNLVHNLNILGHKKINSEDAALTILSVYGKRGLNLSQIAKSNPELKSMLNLLHTTLLVTHFWDVVLSDLDLGTQATLPNSLRTDCDYGKAYHFYMMAYYSNKLHKMNYSRETILTSLVLINWVYQTQPGKTKNATRKAGDMLIYPWGSQQADRYRMDGVLAALGAVFPFHDNKVHISKVFANLKKASKKLIIKDTEKYKNMVNVPIGGYEKFWDQYRFDSLINTLNL